MDEVEKLIQQLKDPDAWSRMDAARALGKLMGAGAKDILLDLVKDEPYLVNSEAYKVLQEIGGLSLAEHLFCQVILGDGREVWKLAEEHVSPSDFRSDFERFLEKAKKRWGPHEMNALRGPLTKGYILVMRTLAIWKELQMDGVLSEGTIPKPSGKKGIYRAGKMRRVVNG